MLNLNKNEEYFFYAYFHKTRRITLCIKLQICSDLEQTLVSILRQKNIYV
jgi:hypothetical protein